MSDFGSVLLGAGVTLIGSLAATIVTPLVQSKTTRAQKQQDAAALEADRRRQSLGAVIADFSAAA